MDLRIKGKAALVCGANRGLGLAAAASLVREGARVILAARTQAALEQAADGLHRTSGADVGFFAVDLSQPDQVTALAEYALRNLGQVDILVNNAGGPPFGTFLEFGDADWLAAFHLNLLSAVRLTKALLPGMMERKWGRIINLTSIAVRQPIDGLILSNAVRAAVHGWAKTLSNEIAVNGITVNNVMPGWTLTDRVRQMTQARAEQTGRAEAEIVADFAAAIPMKRMGQPEDLGELVSFLASEQAGYITGASIPIDGGWAKGVA
jgi:3-oxoacyl-[acyl-carrier protein] reductase